jgi:hypothetical protein
MSSHELERVEVMGQVGSGNLMLSDAAVMLELSFRQAKRLWRRYRQQGSRGLKHGNAGRPSNRGKPIKFRRRVLSRFALTTGLRFSAHSNENTTTKKGDISNKLTMGTFLKALTTTFFRLDCRRVGGICFAQFAA